MITLQFALDQNIDVEVQQVQAAINAATTYLPADLPNPPIYSKVNPADAPILTLALTSDSLPLSRVEDVAETALAQKISQLPGVGLVSISGGQKPAVRMQANPTALASYGLSFEDMRAALAAGERRPGQRRNSTVPPSRSRLARMTSCFRAAITTTYHRLPQRGSGAPGRRRLGGRQRRNVKQAAWVNTRPLYCEHSTPAGRQYYRSRGPHQKFSSQLQSSLPAAVKSKS